MKKLTIIALTIAAVAASANAQDYRPYPSVSPGGFGQPLDRLPDPPRTRTWGETPYAPAIPPIMRNQPITNENALIPPVARGYQYLPR